MILDIPDRVLGGWSMACGKANPAGVAGGLRCFEAYDWRGPIYGEDRFAILAMTRRSRRLLRVSHLNSLKVRAACRCVGFSPRPAPVHRRSSRPAAHSAPGRAGSARRCPRTTPSDRRARSPNRCIERIRREGGAEGTATQKGAPAALLIGAAHWLVRGADWDRELLFPIPKTEDGNAVRPCRVGVTTQAGELPAALGGMNLLEPRAVVVLASISEYLAGSPLRSVGENIASSCFG
jgi:hypothetical protein